MRHPLDSARGGAHERGIALLDALVAFAILGFVALASLRALDEGLRAAREAERLDRAREAASAVIDELETIAWHALPSRFEAASSDEDALLEAPGGGPAAWEALVAALPSGAIAAGLEGVATGGGAARFEDAIALRVRVVVRWRERAGERSIALVTVRT